MCELKLIAHIMLLVSTVLTFNFVEFINGNWKEFDWYVPSMVGIILFGIIETIFWLCCLAVYLYRIA